MAASRSFVLHRCKAAHFFKEPAMTFVHCPTSPLAFVPATKPAGVASMRKAATTCWQLSGGRAMTFTAHTTGALGVASGQLWVTFTNTGHIDAAGQVHTTHAHPRRITGDFLLWPGERFELAAGETVVLEAVGPAPEAGIEWQAQTAVAGRMDVSTSRSADVRGPPHDLRLASAQAAVATARLAVGVADTVFGLRSQAGARTFDAVSSDPSVQCRLY
jgi:hypothetical protein